MSKKAQNSNTPDDPGGAAASLELPLDLSPELSQELSVTNDLDQFGITRVSTPTYHVGDYRYGNLDDAIAEAKRNPSVVKSR